jgi:hypothetical protein
MALWSLSLLLGTSGSLQPQAQNSPFLSISAARREDPDDNRHWAKIEGAEFLRKFGWSRFNSSGLIPPGVYNAAKFGAFRQAGSGANLFAMQTMHHKEANKLNLHLRFVCERVR